MLQTQSILFVLPPLKGLEDLFPKKTQSIKPDCCTCEFWENSCSAILFRGTITKLLFSYFLKIRLYNDFIIVVNFFDGTTLCFITLGDELVRGRRFWHNAFSFACKNVSKAY